MVSTGITGSLLLSEAMRLAVINRVVSSIFLIVFFFSQS